MIEVRFPGGVRDRSIEAVVHRWVARFDAMSLEVSQADATIESARRHTLVSLLLTLETGALADAAISREDPYVAVSDCFRAVRRQLLDRAARPSWPVFQLPR
ncbi:MAG: hypothetical protein ACM31C_17550 [Acidobacteriota bacterium]